MAPERVFPGDTLGQSFGPYLREREARFLVETEWAVTPEDILDRRTKHGLHMNEAEKAAFAEWFTGAEQRLRAAT